MTELELQIQELTRQLADLRTRHVVMKQDMLTIERRLEQLSFSATKVIEQPDTIVHSHEIEVLVEEPIIEPKPYIQQVQERIQQDKAIPATARRTNKQIEDFIGTNVISKVGILITIIGVFIGAKYAIDKDLISPAMRIVTGYLCGGVLLFIALRLKEKYLSFSAVLVGGGLAVTYFITYIAFSFYQLFPQIPAFMIMLVTTVAAVAFALWYNQKIIALLGQVAAYAIPFLLSNNSHNVMALFTYISIINLGLIFLSFMREWKTIYHIAFGITWLIYIFWVADESDLKGHFTQGLLFISINFLTFYATFLAFKIVRKELYKLGEIALLLSNALLYFFVGYYLINETQSNVHLLTYFTLGNAAVHFLVGLFIYKLSLVDKIVSQFIAGLGLLFVTIAIPIELDGNWVTLLWTTEAVIVFLVGFKNERKLYLDLSIPLIIVACISLVQDWFQMYPYLTGDSVLPSNVVRPFFNLNFWLAVSACIGFGIISYQSSRKGSAGNRGIRSFFSSLLPLVFVGLLYLTIFHELHHAFDINISQHINPLFEENNRNIDLLIYSCIYISCWMVINYNWIKKQKFHLLLLLAGAGVTIIFLLFGLDILGEIREAYISHQIDDVDFYFNRYALLAAIALLWLCAYSSVKTFGDENKIQPAFSITFNISLLAIISNEYIHWMEIAGYSNQYKLGLSLIAGGYALTLIFIGLIKKKKHLRVFAISLFSLTLIKLFFYDLSSLSTISKTVVLIVLGALLLIASFLYNKFKALLFDGDDN